MRCRTCRADTGFSTRRWLIRKREKKRSEYLSQISSAGITETEGLCNGCLRQLVSLVSQGEDSESIMMLFLVKKLAGRTHANAVREWNAIRKLSREPGISGRPCTHTCAECGRGARNQYESLRCWECEERATRGPDYFAVRWKAYCEKYHLPAPGTRKCDAMKLEKERERMRGKRADPVFKERERKEQRERMRRLRARREKAANAEKRAP